MTEQKPRHFLKATIREFTTKSWKVGFNVNINQKDFNKFPVNKRWEVQLTMRPRNEKGKYWETHFMVENEFTPEQREQENNVDGVPDNWTRDDDLPF